MYKHGMAITGKEVHKIDTLYVALKRTDKKYISNFCIHFGHH